jgi:hypothetical protein
MTPEQHAAAEIRKTGHSWVDMSVAACALIVSATSLLVAIRHGHSMERMADANARLVQANSWPLLQRYQSDVGPGATRVFSVDIYNNGVGPAKVETVEVTWKGQPMRSPRQLLTLCCGADFEVPDNGIESSGLMGTVLRAGEVRPIVEFAEDPPHQALLHQLKNSLKEIDWRACYCSVFDECWLSDLRTLHPQPVKECPVPKVPFGS